MTWGPAALVWLAASKSNGRSLPLMPAAGELVYLAGPAALLGNSRILDHPPQQGSLAFAPDPFTRVHCQAAVGLSGGGK